MLRHALIVSLLLVACVGLALAQDPYADLTPELRQRLGLPAGPLPALVLAGTSKDEGYTPEQAAVNAPDILKVEVAHLGGQRLLFKNTFAQPPDFSGAVYIIYLDLDNDPATGRQDQYHKGVDCMVVVANDQVSLNPQGGANTPANTILRGARVGKVVYVTLDTPLPKTGDTLALGVHLLSQREGGRGDGTPHQVVQLPRSLAAVPELPKGAGASLRTDADYRYVDSQVRYEKLSDKGLRYDQVAPKQPFKPGRACPEPTLTNTARQPGKAPALAKTAIQVSLLEDSGVDRTQTPISFGFPCPEGGVFDLGNLRVLDGGKEVPAQFTATAFWPDGSLKWVLIDLLTDLKANEDKSVTVELGQGVTRKPVQSPLQVKDEAGKLTILTGALRYVINKQRFNLLDLVAIHKDGGPNDPVLLEPGQPGVILRDEQGKEYSSSAVPPDRVVVEEQGPVKAVVRVEGKYGAADGSTYMRYVARLTFQPTSWAGAPWRVGVAWTTVNDYLKTEFTDVSSLSLPLIPAGTPKYGRMYVRDADGKLQRFGRIDLARKDTVFQQDDRTCLINGEAQGVNHAPGIAECGSGRGSVTVAVQDFWQRWPKGFDWDGNRLSVNLLPTQPGPDFGRGLPHYLLFNLCEGKYRFKWGMSFTERFTLDFSASDKTREALFADTNKPIVAVVPASWYAQTTALGRVAVPFGKQFAVWDKWVADAFAANMRVKATDREYGFLNYGDWYGERGRNWGNNEYDYQHGLFQAFLRTGNRDYYRWALLAARHQADVDTIHAYPDAFYLGAQAPHSVGHTGAWTETTDRGTWETRYDLMYAASNGHNWADGMVDAWCLAGDVGVMQSALQYGEHVAWAMSPNFQALGTHERSAGWSLKAIMGVYRQTYDPEYLAAGKRIAAVALREQKFDEGGAWPHILPLDHANGKPGLMGNNLFLIGILLGGLQTYHEASGDPAVLKAMTSGAQWVAKSWDEVAGGWPYSATPEGTPLYQPSTSLDMLIIQPLAYVAKLTSDDKLWHIVDASLQAVAIGGADSFGKSVAQKLNFAGGTLALLQEWYAKTRPDKGASVLSGDAAWYAAMMTKTPYAKRHAVRAPDEKVFLVQLRGDKAELLVVRNRHGAMNKRSPTGTLKVLSPKGETVATDTWSTDDDHEYRCTLTGAKGDCFKVVINDDQRGIFSLSGDNLGLVMQTSPEFRIGGVGKAKYSFFVPAGTAEFRIKLLGVHTGAYGAVVLSPGGQIVGQHQAANEGSALIQGSKQDVPTPPTHPEQGEVVIKPQAADTGKLWSVVLWAAGDIGVDLVGVPPYLALNPEAWFAVK